MEEQNNLIQEPKKKGNKGLIITLIIIIVLLIGVIALLIIKPTLFNFKTSNNETNSNATQKTNNNDNNTKNDTNEIKALDLNKALNGEENYVYSNPMETKESIGLSLKSNNDKSPILTINWDVFGPHSTGSTWASETIEYKISGFNKNVKDAIVGEIGQSSEGTTFFYLMEDGTVEYTRLFIRETDSHNNTYYKMNYTYEKDNDGKITGQHFETQGSLNGVKDVVKFYNVDVYITNGGGWRTTIGATKDGSFYDLGKIINN